MILPVKLLSYTILVEETDGMTCHNVVNFTESASVNSLGLVDGDFGFQDLVELGDSRTPSA